MTWSVVDGGFRPYLPIFNLVVKTARQVRDSGGDVSGSGDSVGRGMSFSSVGSSVCTFNEVKKNVVSWFKSFKRVLLMIECYGETEVTAVVFWFAICWGSCGCFCVFFSEPVFARNLESVHVLIPQTEPHGRYECLCSKILNRNCSEFTHRHLLILQFPEVVRL